MGPPVASSLPRPYPVLYTKNISSQSSPSMSLLQRLTEGIPVVINQRRTPSFFCNVVDIDICLRCSHVLSSQRQFIRIFPDHHLRASFWNFRLSYFKTSHAPVQVSNLKGAFIVNVYEFTQAVRETFSTLLTQVLHNIRVRGRLHLLAHLPTTSTH